jgi:glutathione S-transferase
MAAYKLYYFPTRGRVEPIRLLFAYKGIHYEDIRITYDEWSEFKPKTPFGSMPVLEEDGNMLGGSLVILRYLAEKPEFDCAGNNQWDNAWLANIADFINDFTDQMIQVFFEKDEQKKKELEEKFKTEVVPKYLVKLNELALNEGYLWGDKLTWPDLILYNISTLLHDFVVTVPEFNRSYPGLEKLIANVESNPGIAEWLKQRPNTPY